MEHNTPLPNHEALAAHGDLYTRARTSALEALARSGNLRDPADQAAFIDRYARNYIDAALMERARLKAVFERSGNLPAGHA